MDRSKMDISEWRTWSRWTLAGMTVAAVLGVAFVVIGLRLALSSVADLPPASALRYARLFGLRDAFLGAFTLLLLVTRQRRALLLLLAGAMVLPVVDTIAVAEPEGLRAAAGGNLPAEVPLVLATVLLTVGGRLERSPGRGQGDQAPSR